MSAAHASPFVTALGTASLFSLGTAAIALVAALFAFVPFATSAVSLPVEYAIVAIAAGTLTGLAFALIASLLAVV